MLAIDYLLCINFTLAEVKETNSTSCVYACVIFQADATCCVLPVANLKERVSPGQSTQVTWKMCGKQPTQYGAIVIQYGGK